MRALSPDYDERSPRKMKAGTRSLLRLEWFLLLVGAVLLATYGLARLHSHLSAHRALERFKAAKVADPYSAPNSGQSLASAEVDFSLWSEKRVRDYKESLLNKADLPLAVLHVGKLHLEVPVFDGTDELTLNCGVGRIVGTAKPGEAGNIGIAGHRDGYFRGLKDVGVGDRIELITSNRTDTYVVDKVQIVEPDDVSVLQSSSSFSLTLVTCYPFYFVGNAPRRYIVHASITDPDNNHGSYPGSIVTKN